MMDAEYKQWQEDWIQRLEEIEKRMTQPDGFITLYLETVPRSFIKITPEDEDNRQKGDGPWTLKDQVTSRMITVRRAACSLPGCMCALALVRVED